MKELNGGEAAKDGKRGGGRGGIRTMMAEFHFSVELWS